jgi:hypothetical protein
VARYGTTSSFVRSDLAQPWVVPHGGLVPQFLNLKLPRRRVMLAVAVCGAVASGLAIALYPLRPALLDLEHAESVLSLLESRSPGERTAAELNSTKGDKSGAQDLERALGKEFPPEEISTFASPEHLLALADAPDVMEFPVADTPLAADGAPAGFFLPPGLIGAGGSGGGGPGAGGVGSGPGFGGPGVGPGGGGPGGGGTVDGSTPPLVPPAVPEPDTWAMMMLGMGLCGYALRRRNRVRLSASTRSCGVS